MSNSQAMLWFGNIVSPIALVYGTWLYYQFLKLVAEIYLP